MSRVFGICLFIFMSFCVLDLDANLHDEIKKNFINLGPVYPVMHTDIADIVTMNTCLLGTVVLPTFSAAHCLVLPHADASQFSKQFSKDFARCNEIVRASDDTRPFVVIVCDSENASHDKVECAKASLRLVATEWAVSFDLTKLLFEYTDSGLDIKRITNKDALRDWIYVCMRGEEPVFDFEATDFPFLLRDDFELYVGYYQGQPVSCIMLHCTQNIAGIYEVVTVPSMRERGFATHMVQHCLHLGKEKGCTHAFLPAVEREASFYERLGFVKEFPMWIYVRNEENWTL